MQTNVNESKHKTRYLSSVWKLRLRRVLLCVLNLTLVFSTTTPPPCGVIMVLQLLFFYFFINLSVRKLVGKLNELWCFQTYMFCPLLKPFHFVLGSKEHKYWWYTSCPLPGCQSCEKRCHREASSHKYILVGWLQRKNIQKITQNIHSTW